MNGVSGTPGLSDELPTALLAAFLGSFKQVLRAGAFFCLREQFFALASCVPRAVVAVLICNILFLFEQKIYAVFIVVLRGDHQSGFSIVALLSPFFLDEYLHAFRMAIFGRLHESGLVAIGLHTPFFFGENLGALGMTISGGHHQCGETDAVLHLSFLFC